MKPDLRPAFALATLLLLVPDGRAQVVSDGATNTLNHVTNTVSGSAVVGTNGSFTLFIITNGAVLTNSGIASIGLNAGANSNTVFVTGTNSLWTSGGALRIGNDGSANVLVVSNGGTMANAIGTIGNNAGSSNNLAVVTGAGSLWTSSGALRVGNDGSGNRLVVSNGGTVSAANVFVGNTANSANNRLTVDGGSLFATNAGGNAALDIRRGTNVLNAGLIVADNLLLTNSAGFFDFNGGTLITSGGTVSNGQAFVVGASGTTAATLDVRSNAPLVLNNGLTLGANTAAAGNRLLITNGGTLSVTGAESYLGEYSTASNNVAVVTGAGSLWTNSSSLYVGYLGSGNQLVVSNGGVVRVNRYGSIGYESTGNYNTAIVTGTNSLWTIDSSLTVGEYGSGNQLVVSNGGVVADSYGSLGLDSGANNNVAVVTGTGSLWTNSSELDVGFDGSGNQLVVSDGGVVANGTGYLGTHPGANSNVATVTGAGSLWTNSGDLYVGLFGSGNQLVVSNGGVVQAASAYVGLRAAASNNVLRLANGTLAVPGGVTVNANNTLAGSGTINGDVTSGGAIAPGNSAGSLSINGSLSLAATAGMSFEIGGLIPTNQYDQVTITSFVQFAGTLSLSLINGFIPAATNSFTLMTFASSTGFFANAPSSGAVLQTTDGLRKFTVLYTPTSLVLTNAQQGTNFILTSIIPAANQVTISFQSIPTNQYEVQYTSTLTTTNWTVATNAVNDFTTNTPGITTWIDKGTNTGGLPLPAVRFYRVRQF